MPKKINDPTDVSTEDIIDIFNLALLRMSDSRTISNAVLNAAAAIIGEPCNPPDARYEKIIKCISESADRLNKKHIT